MRRLGVRVDRVAALRPPPPPPAPAIDPSSLTPAQKQRAAEIPARLLAVGLSGLTDEDLDDALALQKLLMAPRDGEG